MIVENGPLGFPSVGLDTLSAGDTFELQAYSQGTEFVVCHPDHDAPSAPGKIAVFRLRDGAIMLLNHDGTVVKRPFKVVPVG